MEKEEKAQLEAQHRKETESLKEEVTRLTSLLEQVHVSLFPDLFT